jgi:peptidoglycan LD-endopeptidase CwlK
MVPNLFVLVLLLYFLLACFAVWLTLFAEGRAFATVLVQVLAGVLQPPWHWVVAHRWAMLAGLALVVLPPTAIVLLSSGLQLEGFSDTPGQENVQVVTLLKGEQLVPPAPLTPEFFTTPEVEQYRPMLQTANRNWQLLDAEFEQRLLLVFKIMREQHGYEMTILEGYRSHERQDALSRLGPNVTNAKAWQSHHQYGLAADCAFLFNGKILISEKNPWAMKGYALYGEVAESVGFHWGGRWKMMDFGHVEWRKPGARR